MANCPCKDGARGSQGIQGPQGPQGIQGIQGIPGTPGLTGPQGLTGLPGANGAVGPVGPVGPIGLTGSSGAPGAVGVNGVNGSNGTDGTSVLNGIVAPTSEGVNGDFYIDTITNLIYGPKAGGVWPLGISLIGPQGPPGISGSMYADFYALMPGDNLLPIAVGAPVAFPQDGPISAGGITRINATTFNIQQVGDYRIHYNVNIIEVGQLGVSINGTIYPPSVMGKAAGTNQITNEFIISILIPNSQIRVVNPPGNPTALTITPIAGGTVSVSAHLIITGLNI